MAQIVAEHLGVAYDDVTIVQADSQSTPYGPGTGGSRTAVVAGGAAREATVAVREKVLTIAAHMMEAAPEDLEIAESVVSVRGTPSKSVTHAGRRQAGDAQRANELPGEIGRRAGGDGPVPPQAVPHVVERHPHLRGRGRRRDLAAARACATSSPRTAGR